MTVRIVPRGAHVTASPRRAVSYLDDGTQLVWEPGLRDSSRIAVDGERIDREPPSSLSAGFDDPVAFYTAWTRIEVVAKLADIPVLHWFRTRGWSDELAGAWLETFRLDRTPAIVTVGASLPPPCS